MLGETFVIRISETRHSALLASHDSNTEVFKPARACGSPANGKEEEKCVPSVLDQCLRRRGGVWFAAQVISNHFVHFTSRKDAERPASGAPALGQQSWTVLIGVAWMPQLDGNGFNM